MSRPGQEAAPQKSERDLAEYHELMLVRARHRALIVVHKGLNRQVATVCLHKGDAEMTVYLTGIAEPVRPCEITFREIPT